jgi:competence protein ComEA
MHVSRRFTLLVDLGLLVGTMGLCATQAAAPEQAAGSPPRSEAADKADFESVCGACHSTTLASELRTEAQWKDTIERMVAAGANGTDDQLEAVMRTLLRTVTKVNVNTATAEELPLPLDISDATAGAVVKYRAEHGNFKTLDDLKKVPGISAEKIDARKNRLSF